VGDDDQTIFSYRGSDPHNIIDYHKRYENIKTITLEDNFRSSKAIVKIAEQIVSKNKARTKKVMVSKSDVAHEKGDVIYCDFADTEQENIFIAERINEMVSAGMNYSDIAILVRQRKIIPAIYKVLHQNGIPAIVDGVNELFNMPEVKAMRKAFDYMSDKGELSDSFAELWKSVHPSITEEHIARLVEYLREQATEGLEQGHDFILQQKFIDIINCLDLMEDGVSIDPLRETLMYNLGKFSKVIDDFEMIFYKDTPKNKLSAFTDFLYEVAEDYYAEGKLDKSHIQPNAVRVFTIHGAKGLEFQAVFIPNLVDGFFPAQYWHEKIWNVTIPKKGIENSERFIPNMADERKLFYVAVTRAQKFLYATRPRLKWVGVTKTYKVVNQWFEEKPSPFFGIVSKSEFAERYYAPIKIMGRKLLKSNPKPIPLVLNFMFLQYYFECPHKFKLAYLYSFMQPINTPRGYGKSLRDIVIGIQTKRMEEVALNREAVVAETISLYFNLPYAPDDMKANMLRKADKLINSYLEYKLKNHPREKITEKDLEIDMGGNIMAVGRTPICESVDEKGKPYTSIYEIIATGIDGAEEIKTEQLQIRALGLYQATGQIADYVEVFNLDSMKSVRTPINEKVLKETQSKVEQASKDIRQNTYKINMERNLENCFYKDYYKMGN